MAKRILLFASILMSFCTNVITSTVFNVKDYGAKGNGTDIDSHRSGVRQRWRNGISASRSICVLIL